LLACSIGRLPGLVPERISRHRCPHVESRPRGWIGHQQAGASPFRYTPTIGFADQGITLDMPRIGCERMIPVCRIKQAHPCATTDATDENEPVVFNKPNEATARIKLGSLPERHLVPNTLRQNGCPNYIKFRMTLNRIQNRDLSWPTRDRCAMADVGRHNNGFCHRRTSPFFLMQNKGRNNGKPTNE
jgi:hypothetical protein